MSPRAAILALVFSGSVFGAEIGIAFSGVLTAEGKTRLALTDTARKITTWVEPGAEFNGYTVTRYDPKEEAVFLKKGGRETRLGLVASKTPETASISAAASPGSVSAEAANAAIRSNLRQLTSAARQYQLERGVNTVAYTDLVGPGKIIRELKSVAGENYSTLTFGPNVTGISVTTANGATITMDVPSTGSAAAGGIAAQPQMLPAPSTPAPSAIAPGPAAPALPQTAPLTTNTPPTLPSSARTADSTSPNTLTAAATAANSTAGPSVADPSAPQTTAPLPLPAVTDRQSPAPNYTIQGGDTWQRISESTGVPVPQLKQLNPAIPDGAALPTGQSIRVR